MGRSKIEWLKNEDGSQGYSINPVKGLCPVDCKDNQGKSYCYARRMYKRFKWDPEIRYDLQCLLELKTIKKPSRIFVGSTMELFGKWIDPVFLAFLFGVVGNFSQHTFIFLTKQPQNLSREWPDNCWVGGSAVKSEMLADALANLDGLKVPVRFISFEPLLERIEMYDNGESLLSLFGINWVIIGSRTQPVRHPPREWVDEIMGAADKVGTPIFVKEPMASHFNIHRQEYPKERI